ncbi:hypothetical protein M3Y94_00975000 [Aphelenchoides besseyi]|nr:hypothetical protein M3Y94_00975000 [Aphelenchoides besseyi]KAI6224578.1 hypothetical protein M3Y95_00767800 [Aphelenchoides besseyi]
MGGRNSESDDGSLSSDEGEMTSRSSPSTRRSRERDRRTPIQTNGKSFGLSRFYRSRFGSHSPEDYMNLRVSGIKNSLSKDEIRTVLEDELRKMAPFEIKIVRNPDDDERFAYVNFRKPECAKNVRRSMFPRLQRFLGNDLMMDPTGVLRDQDGKYIPDRFNRALLASDAPGGRRRYSPPSRQSSYGNNNNNTRPFNLNQEDNQATRTLFVGNLPGDVRSSELHRTFEEYGDIEDIDVKLVNDGMAAYAFVVFQSLNSAMKALKGQHGHSIRGGGSTKCQIGYGRSQISQRLWIGGLGEWTKEKRLLEEFDRYGEIEQLEYTSGAPHAYIRFKNTSSATDACNAMRNYKISGHEILVDYAKDKKPDRKRPHSPASSDGSSRRKRGPRTPSRSKSPVQLITNYEQLTNQVASTWKGMMILKKNEYHLRLHRVAGREHLLQELLRDEEGTAIKLKLDQRVAREPTFYDKLLNISSSDLAFMVGAEGSHSFTPMIEYLNEKKAIGMSTTPNALVYVLPYCSLTTKIVKKFAPNIAIFEPNSNFLLVILKSIST